MQDSKIVILMSRQTILILKVLSTLQHFHTYNVDQWWYPFPILFFDPIGKPTLSSKWRRTSSQDKVLTSKLTLSHPLISHIGYWRLISHEKPQNENLIKQNNVCKLLYKYQHQHNKFHYGYSNCLIFIQFALYLHFYYVKLNECSRSNPYWESFHIGVRHGRLPESALWILSCVSVLHKQSEWWSRYSEVLVIKEHDNLPQEMQSSNWHRSY